MTSDNNLCVMGSFSNDVSIRFFTNDDDRYFDARFCGNGKCTDSPLGNVTLIIYGNNGSNSFGEVSFGNLLFVDGNSEGIVEI